MNLILSFKECLLIKKERELISKRIAGKTSTINPKILPALCRIITLSIMLLTFGLGCVLAQKPLTPKISTILQTSAGVNSSKSSKSKEIIFSRLVRFNNSVNETDTPKPRKGLDPVPSKVDDGGGGGGGGGGGCVTVPGTISVVGANPVCSGNSITLNLTGHNGGVQWQSSTDNTSYTTILGETGSSFVTNITTATYYRAFVSFSGCSLPSNSVLITVTNASAANGGTISVNGSSVVCSSTNSTSLNLTGYTGTIQWQSSTDNSNFTNIPTATANTYTATNITTTTYYRAVVTNGACGSATSNTSILSVYTPPVITTDVTSPAAVCAGGIAPQLSVIATGVGLSYQWYSLVALGGSPSIIGGEVNSTYTPPINVAGTYYYYVQINNACAPLTSSVATVLVNPLSNAGTISGVGSGLVCSSTNSTKLDLTGITGTIQWQSSTDNTNFANIPTATANTYTATNITTTTHYRAVVTNGACGSATSNTFTLLVYTPPVITTDVTSPAAVCVGGTAPQLSVIVTGAGLSYQWYSLVALGGSPSIIVGEVSSSYTPPVNVAGTYYYYVQVNNACAPLTSSVATVVVNLLSNSGSISGVGAVCSSINSTLLNLTGNTGTIQWQSSTDNSNFTNISAATSNTYTATNITTTTHYRAVVTNGACGSATSNTTVITVSLPVVITANVISPAAVCAGGTAPQLSVTATGDGLSYQWYSLVALGGIPSIIGGAVSSTYTPPVSVTGTYYYYVMVGGNCGNVQSSTVTVVVKAASTVPTSVSTSNNNFCAGGSADLSIIGGVLGDGASWKWYSVSCGASSIGSGTGITVSPLITTSYFVRAEGDCNTTNCVSITVTIKGVTAIVTEPLNTIVTYGNNANFSVSASGSNILYQWQRFLGSAWINIDNGVEYSNTSTSILTVLLPTVSMSGYQYRCIVRGDCGSTVTSTSATLTVEPAITTSFLKLSATSVRYKDYLTLTATIKPINNLSILTGGVTFLINGISYGSANAVPIPGDIEGKLVAMLIVQINEMPGGPYTVSSSFIPSPNSNYSGSNTSQSLFVTPRTASPYSGTANFYTGQVFAWSTSINSNTATALLSAVVKDNSSPTGDVRAAKITFYYVSSTGVLSPIPGATNLAVGLINVSDGSLGTASANVQLNISNLNAASYQIAVGVSGAYTNNPYDANSQVIVTVSKPIGTGYIVGGSQVANNNKSAGLIQGAATANTDYGFNIQYTKSGTNPKGQAWFIVRSYNKTDGTLDNKLHTYLLNSNAISTFNTVIRNGTGTATLTSKANLSEQLPNGTVVPIEGNGNLQLVASQNGCTQQIAVTFFRKAGGIWFANNWSGTGAVLQQVNLESTVFVAGAINNCAESPSIIVGSATEIFSLSNTNLMPHEQKVWPNPSKTSFNLLINGNNKTVAEIRIFDMSGRQLNSMRAAPGALIKFGDNYRPGMYIIKIFEGRDEKVIKVVKQ